MPLILPSTGSRIQHVDVSPLLPSLPAKIPADIVFLVPSLPPSLEVQTRLSSLLLLLFPELWAYMSPAAFLPALKNFRYRYLLILFRPPK